MVCKTDNLRILLVIVFLTLRIPFIFYMDQISFKINSLMLFYLPVACFCHFLFRKIVFNVLSPINIDLWLLVTFQCCCWWINTHGYKLYHKLDLPVLYIQLTCEENFEKLRRLLAGLCILYFFLTMYPRNISFKV